MSHYLSFLRDRLISTKEEKIPKLLILGLSNSGKSSVVNRLLFGTVSEVYPAQSTCFMNIAYGKSVVSILEVDEETSRESPYFQDILVKIDGIIFVLDTTTERHVEPSFEYLYGLLDKIPQETPILLLANKMDVEGHVELVDILQDPAFSVITDDINRSIYIQDVSIKTGENFYLAFDWIISRTTGRTPLHEEVNIMRIIILEEGGVPAFDYAFDDTLEETDNTLLGGLIHALNIMASTIFNSESVMDVIKLGEVKLVNRKMAGWSIILFIDREDSESKAQVLAEEILNAFIEEKERDPTKELPKEAKFEILNKIPEIAMLLGQEFKSEM